MSGILHETLLKTLFAGEPNAVSRTHQTRTQEETQLRLLWLIPFSASAVYLASDHTVPHNWQFAARCAALGIVATITAYEAVYLHRAELTKRVDRIVSPYFLLSVTLGILVVVARLVVPLPSAADNDASRINRILNLWLFWPFTSLAVFGSLLLAISSKSRRCLGLYCGLILMVTLALSMQNGTLHVLRSFLRALPYSQML